MNLNSISLDESCILFMGALLGGNVFEVVQGNPPWLGGGGNTLAPAPSISAALQQPPSQEEWVWRWAKIMPTPVTALPHPPVCPAQAVSLCPHPLASELPRAEDFCPSGLYTAWYHHVSATFKLALNFQL